MDIDRRKFLKIAGLSAVMGIGGKAAFELLAPKELEASLREVPLTQGKKWGMVVNMAKMDDEIMKRCMEACNRVHNIPNFGDPRVEIKWIWEETYEHSFPGQEHEYIGEKYLGRNFLLMCNHCTDPPCCRVCPTGATWKREDGIVMMDWHRCIGCRFCMAGCPYGSRSFNWGDPRKAPKELNPDFPTNRDYPTRSKGVVEKCTFCDERIARGQIPACVEAANEIREGALVFGDLDDPDSDIRKVLRAHYSIRRKPELGTGPNVYYII
ncbi:MAG: 4Fe-4S dicluster domain-containing protein [Deltaproteobacteria bacterium]|nr:4Fe-4S dicluster domain-containing protein [Deltaproteobacteria bacterium]MBW1919343.1 4Fe-4S dicluster domain-containing protein [Deltaproteobacteria bacterium]MBW1934087.1 4Fe-4S dicluster domain-containing protein [Deltaproteobacteria bacterium]MBW1976341.1 4Fe-4S dicluster domain-containing protein [Deltaproteobacteria bacterium]MBW2043382.1 4Fe-4S dicluster domain-containing protein [Deltaproteobacteria bacterium]